jgi:hypothetical protein
MVLFTGRCADDIANLDIKSTIDIGIITQVGANGRWIFKIQVGE